MHFQLHFYILRSTEQFPGEMTEESASKQVLALEELQFKLNLTGFCTALCCNTLGRSTGMMPRFEHIWWDP